MQDLIVYFAAHTQFFKASNQFIDRWDCYLSHAPDEPRWDEFNALEAENARRELRRIKDRERRERKRLEAANKPLVGRTPQAQQFGAGLYLITTAQNNTPVNTGFWQLLVQFAEYNKAQLLVGKMPYNKSLFHQEEEKTEYYVPEVAPYLVAGNIDLGAALFVSSAHVNPTAKNPLSGFAGAGTESQDVIIPHSKIALECLPRNKGQRGKRMFATGACTISNYIERKAGSIAHLEHCIAALLIDTRAGSNADTFTNARQIAYDPTADCIYDNGVKYWLDKQGDIQAEIFCPLAMQPGDIHAEKMSDKNMQLLADEIEKLKPHALILHDVLDFSSRNHHNIKDAFFIGRQANNVEDDLNCAIDTIDWLATAAHDTYVVLSNHDAAFDKWLVESDWKADPINAKTYLKAALRKLENPSVPAFEAYYKKHSSLAHFVDESRPLNIGGVCMENHGHSGPNGARGTPQAFRRLGVPINIGHTHTPGICGKVYVAGVAAELDMGYNVGPSSWHYAYIATYPNAIRQVIFY